MDGDLQRQANMKALDLLADADRTEAGLREKLRSAFPSEEIVSGAVEYVKSLGYLDDASYAARYVETRKSVKSRRELYYGLLAKGVEKETVSEALREGYTDGDEAAAIERLARKRGFAPDESPDGEKKKVCAYLVRKGFPYENVARVLNARR